MAHSKNMKQVTEIQNGHGTPSTFAPSAAMHRAPLHAPRCGHVLVQHAPAITRLNHATYANGAHVNFTRSPPPVNWSLIKTHLHFDAPPLHRGKPPRHPRAIAAVRVLLRDRFLEEAAHLRSGRRKTWRKGGRRDAITAGRNILFSKKGLQALDSEFGGEVASAKRRASATPRGDPVHSRTRAPPCL